jgi:thioesterase domain-containing protein
LECLGRLDEQVKIRGFRIEPAEVEAALARCPGVRDAVVNPVEAPSGEKRLVAFVAGTEGHTLTPAGLRRSLEPILPAYMIPAGFVLLERLPLTPSGKADRRALAALDVSHAAPEETYVPPRTATERKLAGIWSELLGVARVGLHDDFFRLGGHSLLATRLVARIGAEMSVEVPLRVLVERPTVAAVGRFLDEAAPTPAAGPGLVALQRGGGRRPPLFLLPAADGSLSSYLELVRHLDPDQVVYGIALPEGEQAEAAGGIEAMATHAIERIGSVQPEGPYQLGGWSWGGIVAYEAARQLRERGQGVSLLALFDTWPLDGSRVQGAAARAFAPASAQLGVSLEQWLRLTPAERSSRVLAALDAARGPVDQALGRMAGEMGLPFEEFALWLEELLPEGDRLRSVVAEAARALGAPSEARRRELREKLRALERNLGALTAYRLRPHPGTLTLFTAAGGATDDPSLGWRELATAGVDVRAVRGHHFAMLREPHVRDLAEKLRASLEAAVEAT